MFLPFCVQKSKLCANLENFAHPCVRAFYNLLGPRHLLAAPGGEDDLGPHRGVQLQALCRRWQAEGGGRPADTALLEEEIAVLVVALWRRKVSNTSLYQRIS